MSRVGFTPTVRGAGICPAPIETGRGKAEAAREARRGVGVSGVGFIPIVRGAGICPAPVKGKDRGANPPAFQEGNEFPLKGNNDRRPQSSEWNVEMQ